jgi:hypothetical protein
MTAVIEKSAAKKGKAHQVYKVNGKRVPGVTTVLDVINKPALKKWANDVGLQGIDSATYADALANIGTLAHEMIQEYLGGPQWDRSEYTRTEVDTAENAVLSFFEWEKVNGVKLETEAIELQLVSEKYLYGGTVDWLGRINGKTWLVDIKTSKALYPENSYQVAAYHRLLTENGYRVDGVRVLRVGRSEDEGFDDKIIGLDALEDAWEVFQCAFDLYRTKQQFEKRENREKKERRAA